MKNLYSLVFLCLFGLSVSAQEFPAPSPKASVSQVAGVTSITVDYSSPAVKGRTLFGELVPYGEVWRTGANKATAITFNRTVVIGDSKVGPGSFSVFTVPSEDGTLTFILNSDTELYGARNKDNTKDVVTVETKVTKSKDSVERMRFTLDNASNESIDLNFAWGTHRFSIPIQIQTEAAVMANMEAKEKEIASVYEYYADAANYYFAEGNYQLSKEMGEKSVNMQAKFWNTHTLAKSYKELGEKDAAIKMAQRSLDLSQKAEYKPYIERNEKLLSELK